MTPPVSPEDFMFFTPLLPEAAPGPRDDVAEFSTLGHPAGLDERR